MRTYIIFLAIIILPVYIYAQENKNPALNDTLCIVKMKDGLEYHGSLIYQNDSIVKLRDKHAGIIYLQTNEIEEVKLIGKSSLKHGEYWFENPNSTRYFLSPSAFSLKKGEGYFQNNYLDFNSFYYGISNHFTVGAGFELIGTFSGYPTFFLLPKYSFGINDKLKTGLGVLFVNSSIDNRNFNLGIAYSVITAGNRDDNVSVGIGWGWANEQLSDYPVITFSGMKRISNRIGLVTENWYFSNGEENIVLSYGLRFIGEKMSVDLAFINHKDIFKKIVIGVPYVDFVIRFGK